MNYGDSPDAAISAVSPSGDIYSAFRNGGIWQNGKISASKDDLWPQNPGTKIAANTDMRTISTPGHYYCTDNNTASTLKNCPCTVAFTLTVYRGAGGPYNEAYIIQEYTTYLGDARILQTYNKDSKNWTVHRISFSS